MCVQQVLSLFAHQSWAREGYEATKVTNFVKRFAEKILSKEGFQAKLAHSRIQFNG